jgi:hypothetical protein
MAGRPATATNGPTPNMTMWPAAREPRPPRYSFPAHWAPLGLTFYEGYSIPASYQGDGLVAFHGSASDQVGGGRVGYNVVRVRFKNGQPVAHEDLLRGFIIGNDAWGRPAGLLSLPDSSLLVSDDFGGRIFRIRYVGRSSWSRGDRGTGRQGDEEMRRQGDSLCLLRVTQLKAYPARGRGYILLSFRAQRGIFRPDSREDPSTTLLRNLKFLPAALAAGAIGYSG